MRRTVGIDLAAEPAGTAIASIEWSGYEAVLDTLHVKCNDELVLHWMHHPEGGVGIDCPFGWPVKFVNLLQRHSSRSVDLPPDLPSGWRREYVLRATDLWVHQNIGLVPLSVAADRIGHTAIRLAMLMSRLGDHIFVPLDGSGALAEVYPAAALKAWSLPFRGYKRSVNARARHDLVDELLIAAPWLRLGDLEAIVRASDDALDAVVCALVARAVQRGQTEPPQDGALAALEGWIHVPMRPLSELV